MVLQSWTDVFSCSKLVIENGMLHVEMKSMEVGYFDMIRQMITQVAQ